MNRLLLSEKIDTFLVDKFKGNQMKLALSNCTLSKFVFDNEIEFNNRNQIQNNDNILPIKGQLLNEDEDKITYSMTIIESFTRMKTVSQDITNTITQTV